jgi:hypothetical protein
LPKVCAIILGLPFALVLIGMLASSCGGKAESLEERVKAYWQARTQKQMEKAFAFEVPGSVEKTIYLEKGLTASITYTKSEILTIKENGDEAEVGLQTEYLLPGLTRPATSSLTEKWVKIRGQWYHQPPTSSDAGANAERG